MTLTDLYHNQAHEYRVALQREIEHTKRIFNTITPDVRRVLIQSLREIPVPTIDTSGYDSKTLLTTPKPNFVKILRDAAREI